MDDAIAACAGKGKDVRGGHVEVAGQRLTQERPRPEQPRPHRGRRNTKAGRRLVDGHILHLPHDEDRAEGRRQLVDALFEQPPDFRPPQGIGRRLDRPGPRLRARARLFIKGHDDAVALLAGTRISAWLMTMRMSQVESVDVPRNVPMCR